ncbi:MAG: hypothetical protein ACK452_06705 [Bacteroidota bacterium]
MKFEPIQKEHIPYLKFPDEDVLLDADKISERYHALQYAMRFGNSLKHKVAILFKDINDLKTVETSIWYADNQFVVLKGGVVLPVKRIMNVKL